MIPILPRASLLGLLALLGSGCVTAKIQVVDERTALENQILGSYEELDQNLQLVASVRAVDESGAQSEQPRFSTIRQRAVAARQLQQFNRDDIEELKDQGCLGEARDGTLAARPCAQDQDAVVARRQKRLIQEENGARQTLLDFVITTSPDLNEDNRAQLASAYARMNAQKAAPGTWIQTESQDWFRK